MKIKDLYHQLGITPNLAEHMFRVVAVTEFLHEHWTGPVLDWDKIKKTALLHDIGNMVKFDFDKYPQFIGEEIKRIDYWKQKQKETIEKYGPDDHEATKKMLEEIGVGQEIIKVILEKSFGNSVATSQTNNWYPKILYYADLRVLPHGIGTLEERMADVKERMPKYSSRPDFPQLVAACHEIEQQIQKMVNVRVTELTDRSINVTKDKFMELDA